MGNDYNDTGYDVIQRPQTDMPSSGFAEED